MYMLGQDEIMDLMRYCDKEIKETDEYCRALLLGVLDEFDYDCDVRNTNWYDYGILRFSKCYKTHRIDIGVDLYYFKAQGYKVEYGISEMFILDDFIPGKKPIRNKYTIFYHIISDELAIEKDIKTFDFTDRGANGDFIYNPSDLDCEFKIKGATYYFGDFLNGAEINNLLKFRDAVLVNDNMHVSEEYLKLCKARNLTLKVCNWAAFMLYCTDYASDLIFKLRRELDKEQHIPSIHIELIVDGMEKEEIIDWMKQQIERLNSYEYIKDITFFVYFLNYRGKDDVGPGVYIRDNGTHYYKRTRQREVYELPDFDNYFRMYVHDRS